MKIECNNCGLKYDKDLIICPNCQTLNQKYDYNNKIPKSIDELKKWMSDNKVSPSVSCFLYLDSECYDKDSFGYKKDEKFNEYTVYENDKEGKHIIKYKGKDDTVVANILFNKLKKMISKNNVVEFIDPPPKKVNFTKTSTFVAIITIIVVICLIVSIYIVVSDKTGYYNINNKYYYNNGNWYVYTEDTWEETDEPDYNGDLKDYYESYDYEENDNYTVFEEDESIVQ